MGVSQDHAFELGIPGDFHQRVERWETLSRWEKSELGRDLRRLGLSYREIQGLIDVKKSTLATWCRQVELTTYQKRAIIARTGSRQGIPVDTQWRRRAEIEEIRALAVAEAGLLRGDPFWVAGVVLYWAEGSKTTKRLALAHSEVEAARLFVTWARRYHEREAQFRAALNLHADNDEPTARAEWASALSLDPTTDFTKTFIKPDGTGHRKNHLPNGVCRLTMLRSTNAWIRTWSGSAPSRRPLELIFDGAAGATGSAVDS